MSGLNKILIHLRTSVVTVMVTFKEFEKFENFHNF